MYYQAAMPAYAQAIGSRFENILLNGNLIYNEPNEQYQQPYTMLNMPVAGANNTALVVIRKHPDTNEFIIGATLNPNMNANNWTTSSDPRVSQDLQINVAGAATKLNTRRQGSVYYYNKTANLVVFYHLDKWHQWQHPMFWSKDFAFEAEVYDNVFGSNPTIHTIDANPNAPIANGDFRNYITYTSGSATQQYHFYPRSANETYYIHLRARNNTATNALT